ncbi:hypothetical protein GCM10010365_76020 [Streptomyces poonensis]|uniref:Uncharacterized protein n=1 Tax=Streptomyces poonensis TaxID=68255 RepID=A0A918UYH4_9ACTN|nr:hypothetical protein GCM10010365_76020 [Streptomyces poonensis]
MQTLREEFDNTYDRYNGLAAPGSPGAVELREDRVLAGEWGARPVHDAHLAAVSPVMAVMDHLDSLGLLFTSPGGLMTSHTVARGALDIATKPWFLLEPGIDTRERVRRYMNYRLESLKEQSLMVGDHGTAAEVQRHLRERTEGILRAARHHGFSVKGKIADKVRPCYLGPHQAPSTTKLAGQIVVPGGSPLGALLWRATSAVAHGQAHGLLMFHADAPEAPGTGPDDHFVYRQLQFSPQEAAQRCAGAPLATLSMLRRLYAHCGWPAAGLERVGKDLARAWLHISGMAQATVA